MPVNRPRHLSRKVTLQQLAMLWEGLWEALYGPLLVAGIAVAAIASGVLASLPFMVRAAAGALLLAGFLYSSRGLGRLIWPRRVVAMRRMEQASAVTHRPLSGSDDALAAEYLDPLSDAVWEEHQRRQLLALDKIRIAPPRSAWARFDSRALRVPVLLLAGSALLLGPGSLSSNLREAAQLTPAVAPVPLTLDAWLKPPGYTGKPPLLLSGPSMAERLAAGNDLDVPDQSLFTVRVAGAATPTLALLDSTGAELDGGKDIKTSSPQAGVLSVEYKLTRPVTIVVRDGGRDLARYPLAIIPDAPPTITLSKPPTGEARGALVTEWLARDDYGVRSVSGEIELADEQEGGTGFESNGVFLFDPPELKFALRRPNAREEAGKSTNDLASHPWAGLTVNLTLSVKDGAGQEGKSAPVTFQLPERQFVRPLAQALIEQRKQLILYPERSPDVGDALDTLMLYPDGLVERSGHVVAIAMLASRLRNVTGYEDVKSVVAGLWDVAVSIEEGSLENAKSELQALKKELEKALQDGAPPERIAELMNKMRDAMDRYMQAMRKEAERRMKDGTMQRSPQGQQGRMVTPEDLQKMMDALEDLAKGGSREMAEQLLNELDKLLQNLQPGGQQAQGNDDMGQMMDQLGDMMKRQQGLMDDTMREPGEPQDGGEGQMGEQGQQGEEGNRGKGPGNGMGGLADRQRDLQQMLDDLMGQGMGQMPGELGEANRAMRQAEEGLRNGDRDGALRDQGEALDQLRKGAGKLAQQMRENGQGQAESDARDGEGRGGKDDPLGRPRATHNPDDGPDENILPTEQAMKRAREILETLRAKSNEQGLTDSERSYIERLLRGLY